MDERPRCPHCKDAIGVYEPIVTVGIEGRPREASLLRDPQLRGLEAGCDHWECFAEMRSGGL
jgi:hypothetical protein